jgi:hypothetical protein
MTNHAAQQERILQVLKDAQGEWVPLGKIINPPYGQGKIAQYNARIWDLRKQGYTIENKKRHINRITHSWYRLITEGQQTLTL